MVLALEPMVCIDGAELYLDNDNWTWRTSNGLNSAHFEHTVVVKKDSAKILTLIP